MSDRVAAECPSCGKVFAVAASFAGKKIRCPQCQGVIQIAASTESPPVPRPSSSAASGSPGPSPASRPEPRVARPVRSDDPPVAKPARPASTRPAAAKAESQPTRSTPPKKKRSKNYDEEQPWGDLNSYDDPANDPYSDNSYESTSSLPARSRKGGATQKYKADTTPAKSGGSTDGSVVVGILMMVGAVVWFFGGLAFGYIFYYPPILFILGLISTIKGALNLGK
jgi:phage FluMu protein Com